MTNKNPKKHAKTHNAAPGQSNALTFSDHVRELRRRALWVILVFLATSALAYNYHDLLIQIVMSPLGGQKLIYLTPGGGFSFIFQITLYAGLIAAAPMVMYQLYGFVRPTLPAYAQRGAVKVAVFATLLMIVGVAYGYFVAVPAALTFLSTFAGTEILPSLTADSYLSFFLSYVGGLALLFQLPLLLIFWHWIHPMKPGGLLKSERFMIIFAFVAAALITPTPDIVNQAMIAVPLIAIYQIGVVTVLVMIRRTRKQQAKQPAVTSEKFSPVQKAVDAPIATAKKTSSLQPLAATVPTKPRPVQRSIDGFSRPVRSSQSPPVPTRPLSVPPRPTSRPPLMHSRPTLRIDGMSPL
jgi:sec-independent protein translocase protein TatC